MIELDDTWTCEESIAEAIKEAVRYEVNKEIKKVVKETIQKNKNVIEALAKNYANSFSREVLDSLQGIK